MSGAEGQLPAERGECACREAGLAEGPRDGEKSRLPDMPARPSRGLNVSEYCQVARCILSHPRTLSEDSGVFVPCNQNCLDLNTVTLPTHHHVSTPTSSLLTA